MSKRTEIFRLELFRKQVGRYLIYLASSATIIHTLELIRRKLQRVWVKNNKEKTSVFL